jgi:hypothetical protein
MSNQTVRLSLILLAAAGCLSANIILPASQWGPGALNIALNVAYNQGTLPVGQYSCVTGFGSGNTGSSCQITDTGTGTSTGIASAYNDVNGIHVYAEVDSAGAESSTAEAFSAFTDTITNLSGVTANFQVGFNVDGSLVDNGGASSFLFVDVWNGYAYSTIQDDETGVQYQEFRLTGSNPTATLPINQNFLTNSVTLAPGASYTFSISMDAYAATSQGSGPSLDNASAITDAANTLTLTTFSATDSDGNPLPVSDFSSSSGVDYSGVSAPEPSTLSLCGFLSIPVFIRIWRRKVQ